MLDETKATEFELILEGLLSAIEGMRNGTARRDLVVNDRVLGRVITIKERVNAMERKATEAKRLLDEAIQHITSNEIQPGLEKLTVAETLTREMIAEVRMDYIQRQEGISFHKLSDDSRNKQIMWYGLKEKYLPMTREKL